MNTEQKKNNKIYHDINIISNKWIDIISNGLAKKKQNSTYREKGRERTIAGTILNKYRMEKKKVYTHGHRAPERAATKEMRLDFYLWCSTTD